MRKSKRRRKVARAISRLVVLTVILVFVIWGLWSGTSCLFGGNTQIETVNLFFYDDIIGSLVPVPTDVKKNNLPENAIYALISGPGEHASTDPTINKNTRLLSLKIDHHNATVNLSSEIKLFVGDSLSEKEVAYSVINTLLLLPGINSVSFLIDGQKPTVMKKSFDISGIFTEPFEPDVTTRSYRLYFPDKQGRFIGIENTSIRETTNTVDTAKLLTRRYLQGPKSHELMSWINPATKVLGATLKQSLLMVNLSGKIIESNISASAETMFLRSITWTLTELTGVKSLEIHVDGKKIDTLFGHHSYHHPFSRWDETRLLLAENTGNPTLIYFVSEKENGEYMIVPRQRHLAVAGEVLSGQLDYLFSGPTPSESEKTITSCIPDGTEGTVSVEGDTIKLDLTLDTKQMKSKAFEEAFIQQILMTLTETRRDSGVLLLTINGMIQEKLPYGTSVSGNLTR